MAWITGAELLERCLGGLVDGSLVAVLAVGFAVVFRSARFLHVALADLATLGGGLAVFAASTLDLSAAHMVPRAAGILVILAACGLACGGVGLAVERIVFRPLRSEPAAVSTFSSIGLSLAAVSLASLMLGRDGRACFDLLPGEPLFPAFGRRPTAGDVLIVSIVVSLLTAVWTVRRGLVVSGRESPVTARSSDRVIRRSFFTGGVLAGATGAVMALTSTTITAATGTHLGLQALLAAAIGGLGGVRGAVLGGLVIGCSGALVEAWVGEAWVWPVTFVWLLLIMVVRIPAESSISSLRPEGPVPVPTQPPGRPPLAGPTPMPCQTAGGVESPAADSRRDRSGGGDATGGSVGRVTGRAAWILDGLTKSPWTAATGLVSVAILTLLFPSVGPPVTAVVTACMLLLALGAGAGWVGLVHLGVLGFFSLGRAVGLAVWSPSPAWSAGPAAAGAMAAGVLATIAVAAALAACTRRLDRNAFAIVTFGFTEAMIRALGAEPAGGVVGGPPAAGGWWWPSTGLALVGIAALMLAGLWRSRIGLRASAVRQDESAAAAVGLSITRARSGGCILSAALAGLAGGFHACSGGGPATIDSVWPATATLVAALGVIGSGADRGVVLAALLVAACGGPWNPQASGALGSGLQMALGLGLVWSLGRRPEGLFESGRIAEEIRFARLRTRRRSWLA
jgi:branched-chain amino acid transport system permease protein